LKKAEVVSFVDEAFNAFVRQIPMRQIEDKKLLAQILLLSLVGLLVAVWIFDHHLSIKHANSSDVSSFCSVNETFDCNVVAKSEAAEWFGIPVAGFGILFYLAFIACGFVYSTTHGYSNQQSRGVYFFLAVVGAIPSLYLLLVSAFILKTFCLMCLLLDLVNLALLFVTAKSLYKHYPLFDSLIIGFETLVFSLLEALYLRQPQVNTRRMVQLMLLVVLFAAVTIVQVPEYFARSSSSAAASTELKTSSVEEDLKRDFVYRWSRSASVEIPLNTADSLENRDFFLGDENAPISIVTFSDFECPACKKMSQVMEEVVSEHKETRLIFKNYPLDMSCNSAIHNPIHDFACKAAKMARCAGAQGQQYFWAMHDAIYDLTFFTEAQVTHLPDEMGIDRAKFDSCLNSDAQMERVKKDVAEGNSLKVNRTPTVYINGKQLSVNTKKNLLYVVEYLKSQMAGGEQAK